MCYCGNINPPLETFMFETNPELLDDLLNQVEKVRSSFQIFNEVGSGTTTESKIS